MECQLDEFKRQNLGADLSYFEYDGGGKWFERKQVTDQFQADARKYLNAVWAAYPKQWIKWLKKCGSGKLCTVNADDNIPPWDVENHLLKVTFDYAESANDAKSRFQIRVSYDLLSRRLSGECISKPVRVQSSPLPLPSGRAGG